MGISYYLVREIKGNGIDKEVMLSHSKGCIFYSQKLDPKIMTFFNDLGIKQGETVRVIHTEIETNVTRII